MRTQSEIFNQIAISIIDVLPQGQQFNYVILEIKRVVANVGYTGYYITNDNKKNWLDILNFKLDTQIIEDLYTITQTQFPIHANWNRARYTLFPEGKMEIEYIWDEELQNEIDRLNNKPDNI